MFENTHASLSGESVRRFVAIVLNWCRRRGLRRHLFGVRNGGGDCSELVPEPELQCRRWNKTIAMQVGA